jgi:TrmH family RNA methyltransferase
MHLDSLSVAMVEPRFGLNIGYVARVMKNFGVGRLLIVGRRDVPRSAFRFASHGVDVVREVEYLSMDDLRRRFDVVVGTTALRGRGSRNPVRKTVSLARIRQLGVDTARTVIVLGRDTTGMTVSELNTCDIIIHVPTGTNYPTLNISHALAIVLYELSSIDKETIHRVNRVYLDESIGYFSKMLSLSHYPEHKKKMAIKILGKMMAQSKAEQKEVVALMGVFRKASLALQRGF